MTMTSELPSRPKPSEDEQPTIIDPTERVKSAHDKPDPRFEAALQKAEREERVYAERAEKTEETNEPVEGERDERRSRQRKPTFSFNMTAGDAEEDR